MSRRIISGPGIVDYAYEAAVFLGKKKNVATGQVDNYYSLDSLQTCIINLGMKRIFFPDTMHKVIAQLISEGLVVCRGHGMYSTTSKAFAIWNPNIISL